MARTFRIDCVEHQDADGNPVLHMLFEDDVQHVIEKGSKKIIFDGAVDAALPPRLKRDGKPIHTFLGKPHKAKVT